MELAIPLEEPDEFSYTPGRGIRVSYQGEEILVGSLALLVEHGMTRGLPQMVTARAGCRKSMSHARGKFSEASELRMCCGRKPRVRLRQCDRWV